MQRVRWAVVGTSTFALDWIARGIRLGRNAELAAVVSRDAARGAAAAERVGAPRSYTSIDAIERDAVDGVFLVLPTTQHAPYAVAAARRGLHVISEKPMAPSVAECRRMVEAARTSGVLLAVAQCMEWTAPMVKARALLEAGAIGEVISANVSASFVARPDERWRQADMARTGEGALVDMGVHAVDAITRLLGPVRRVSALVGSRLPQYEGDVSGTLLLEFTSGAHGTLQSHYTCYQNGLEIQGTRGRIWSSAWWGREFAGDLHMQRGDEVVDFELPVTNVYVPQIEHVSSCVLSGERPVISGERGLANIAVIEAALEAARTGRAVEVTAG
ncbi:MAG TPA: Gfo/Idh/MocA family oxidoreductase [Roseiflexaceae bacterium]|nr:Gfo/Idh/MocA family oxidoreductase [Roseiflexaceae bacterium]